MLESLNLSDFSSYQRTFGMKFPSGPKPGTIMLLPSRDKIPDRYVIPRYY